MKIIEQSHEFLKYDDPLKLIEATGRTCYKSEDKITDTSAARFVQMITKAGHYSVLEHASICFEVGISFLAFLTEDPDNTKYLNITKKNRILISGNFRAWLEFIQKENERLEDTCYYTSVDLITIAKYLHFQYPEVFIYSFDQINVGPAKVITEDIMTPEEKLIHTTRTCRFITNRGITHEMVRHRPWAYSQESTRYVRYAGNMEFILPVWFDSVWVGDWSDRESAWQSRFGKKDEDWMAAPSLWLWACESAELNYQQFISVYKQKPEQARGVLPNDLKTEIVCTAPLKEWKHMLDLRTSRAAHPQIRALMKPVLSELQKELPEFFNDVGKK